MLSLGKWNRCVLGFVSHKGATSAALLLTGPDCKQQGWLRAPVPRTRTRATGRFLSCSHLGWVSWARDESLRDLASAGSSRSWANSFDCLWGRPRLSEPLRNMQWRPGHLLAFQVDSHFPDVLTAVPDPRKKLLWTVIKGSSGSGMVSISPWLPPAFRIAWTSLFTSWWWWWGGSQFPHE